MPVTMNSAFPQVTLPKHGPGLFGFEPTMIIAETVNNYVCSRSLASDFELLNNNILRMQRFGPAETPNVT
jgi:hypothetical protein